jgi:hypothetical protein
MVTNILEELSATNVRLWIIPTLLRPDDGGRKLFQNVGHYVPIGVAIYPRRLESSCTT